MRKLQGIILSVLIIVAVTGCAKTDTKSSKKNGLDQGVSAVEDAMSQKRSDDTTNDTQKTKELREGLSKDTIKTPKDFPASYDYGTGKISDYKRSDMLRKMPKPKNNETVLKTKADPQKIQALYLWEKDNVPSVTNFTKDMTESRLWTRKFITGTIINFLLVLNYYLLMVIMVDYTTTRYQASSALAGLAASIFVIGALIVRFFSAQFMEKKGKRMVLLCAALLEVITSALYC